MKRIFVFLTVLAVAATLLAGCAPSPTPGLTTPEPAPTPGQTAPEPAPTPGQTAPEPAPTPGQTAPEPASTPTPTTQPPGSEPPTGTLTVLVTDAPPEYTVTSVVVHFSEVWVHKAAEGEGGKGEWIQLTITGGTFGPGSFDLAELRDDEAKLELAAEELVAGKYTQLYVIMDEEKGVQVTYTEDNGEDNGGAEPVEAQLPSGKLRFVRPFVVEEGENTEILLDFDLKKSVVFTGAKKDGKPRIIVRPVVKLQVTLPDGQDNDNIGHLDLRQKNPDTWEVVEDGAQGTLTYNLSGSTFDFEFEGEGLEPDTPYTLIYYADPWTGDNPGAWIASGTSDGNGEIELDGSRDLNTDLPNPDDYNYDHPVNGQDPPGAKIWLVLSADYNENDPTTGPMTAWNPTEYLFEGNTITYDDTDWEPPAP